MRLHGVWVDTVVEKPTIWRCRCGAMLSTQKAMMRHVAGDTMCQHRGEGMVAYVPESPGPEAPGAGSEGSNPKQQAGLHDDELLVEKVSRELQERFPYIDVRSGQDDQVEWRELAAAAIAAVRGAGETSSGDSLAEARGFTDEDVERGALALASFRAAVRSEPEPLEPDKDDYRNARTVLLAAKPGALSAASSNPSGAVPLEPQEEKLREALMVAADDLDKAANQFASMRESQKAGHNVQIELNPEKFAEKAERARVPLLQDGNEDGSV